MSEQLPSALTTPAEKPQGNAFTRWFKGQSTVGKIRIIVVALLVVVGGPIAYFAAQSAPSSAKVGDCMKGQSENDLKIVACTDPAAVWVVLGRVADKTEAQLNDPNDDSCAAYPTTEAGYWEGEKGKKGFILCLGKK